jgi:adenylylsulfate kinase
MKGMVTLIRGKPFTGKTEIAESLAEQLKERGLKTVIVDQENVRNSLFPEIGYSKESWIKIVERLVTFITLLTKAGMNVILTTTAPTKDFVQKFRECCETFLEVFLDAPPDRQKDIDSTLEEIENYFEESDFPDIIISSEKQTGEIVRKIEELGYIDSYDKKEEEEIKKRLENLGYID